MEKAILISKKIVFLLTMLLLCNQYVNGANFTAVVSGSWNNSVTWGGQAPDATITSDQIIIPAGITVTIDNNVSINGTLASINVLGTLNSSVNSTLFVNNGAIMGNGTISVVNLHLDNFAALTFTGEIITEHVTTFVTNLALQADILVGQSITVEEGVLNLELGGSLELGTGADIIISGGLIVVNGGIFELSDAYNVVYTNNSTTVGPELYGSGLNDVTIDVSNGNNVILTSDLNISGMLSLSSGTLMLNGNDLTITGDISTTGNGSLGSDSESNITVNSIGGIAGVLAFNSTANSVHNLTVNVGQGNSLSIDSDLVIEGILSQW
jgi:hypothetical protein